MATEKAMALRREAALKRLADLLGVDLPQVQGRDPMMRFTALLEKLADEAEAKIQAETRKTAETKSKSKSKGKK